VSNSEKTIEYAKNYYKKPSELKDNINLVECDEIPGVENVSRDYS
jgi:hypothetical protein